MPRELECIPELSAPTAFGSLRSLHNGRPSPRVDRARPEEGVMLTAASAVLVVLVCVLWCGVQLVMGKTLLLGVPPSLQGLRQSPQPMV